MARIEWVKNRLNNWALWKTLGQSGPLGYPQSVFARLGGRGRRAEAVIPIDNIDAGLTDQAVNSLQLTRSHLYLTLQCIYIWNLGVTRTAKKLNRAPSTVKAHLEHADHALALWFSNNAAAKKTANHSST